MRPSESPHPAGGKRGGKFPRQAGNFDRGSGPLPSAESVGQTVFNEYVCNLNAASVEILHLSCSFFLHTAALSPLRIGGTKKNRCFSPALLMPRLLSVFCAPCPFAAFVSLLPAGSLLCLFTPVHSSRLRTVLWADRYAPPRTVSCAAVAGCAVCGDGQGVELRCRRTYLRNSLTTFST